MKELDLRYGHGHATVFSIACMEVSCFSMLLDPFSTQGSSDGEIGRERRRRHEIDARQKRLPLEFCFAMLKISSAVD
jgi:hypothetical protein